MDIEGSHTTVCALLETGAVHCWGPNDIPGDRHRVRPEPIEGLPPVRTLESTRWARWKTVNHVPNRCFSIVELVPIAAERFEHDKCWLLEEELWCEGNDDAAATKLLDGAVELDLFGSNGCLRRSDQSMWCVGAKLPLFSPPRAAEEREPTRVLGLASVIEVVATRFGACALHDAGAISCWGAGQHVPDDERQQHHFIGIPQRVALPGPAEEITATQGGACARVGGPAHCWGRRGTVHDLGPAVALTILAGFACADTGTAFNCLHSTDRTYELPRELPRPDVIRAQGNGRHCRVRRGCVECAWDGEVVECSPTNSAPDACTWASGAGERPSKSDRVLRARPNDTVHVGDERPSSGEQAPIQRTLSEVFRDDTRDGVGARMLEAVREPRDRDERVMCGSPRVGNELSQWSLEHAEDRIIPEQSLGAAGEVGFGDRDVLARTHDAPQGALGR